MPVMKKGSRNRWTTIDNFCFHDKSLSYKEIGLLCSMLSLPDDWKFNVRGLAALHSDGVDSVSNGLNHLIEKGYIYREQANSSKGFREIVYWVYQKPSENPNFRTEESKAEKEESPYTDIPCTENPYTGKRDTEKTYTENPALLNTNELNIKESNTKEQNMYESDSESESVVFTEEEVAGWDDEEFYRHLSDEEYDAFERLLKASNAREISSSKTSLIEYFKKMIVNGWKDFSGKPIRNIEGYVRMNFGLQSECQKSRREKSRREDIIPTYDESVNPPFDEERYREIIEKLKGETRL